MSKPIVWTIAGSDSGGGAGIQADLHTFQALGAYGCSVITAVTAQNSLGVRNIHWVPAQQVHDQLSALHADLPAKAIKIGMLGDAASTTEIQQFLQNYSGIVVLDPVMVATSGASLTATDIKEYVQQLRPLLARADIVTPNIVEAEKILARQIKTHNDMTQAAQQFLALGAKSVLLKGGHLAKDSLSQDYWTNGVEAFWLANTRHLGAYHGTGCTMASAIAAALALGYEMRDALVIAKMYVHRGIRLAERQGQGPSPVAHGNGLGESPDLPSLAFAPLAQAEAFLDCGPQPLGIYPVVDSVEWLARLLPLSVSTVQLRVKDVAGAALDKMIMEAVVLAKRFSARLFINDYWQLAIKHGAYGVHLGQEDLDTADLVQIRLAGLRLGVSTHSYYELARAHAVRPSYLALGPIYPTTSKIMPFAPHGLERLARWRSMVQCQLVAIGGIGLTQLPAVWATGVDGVAMISAITQASNPEAVVGEMAKKLVNFKMVLEEK